MVRGNLRVMDNISGTIVCRRVGWQFGELGMRDAINILLTCNVLWQSDEDCKFITKWAQLCNGQSSYVC